MARYLLDTNVCIAVMRNHAKVIKRIAAVPPGDCAVSTVTSYELFTGVEKCANPAKERAKVELLLKTIEELPFDSAAARDAGRIRAILEAQGQMIGTYDLLLAGQALTLSVTLVTANTKEFSRVPGILLDNWQV